MAGLMSVDTVPAFDLFHCVYIAITKSEVIDRITRFSNHFPLTPQKQIELY